jgi:hypothetical protein
MDKNHVVAVPRRVSRVPSRRDVVRGLAALGIGVATTRPPAPVAATHFTCRHVGKRCNGGAQCCSGICKRHRCRAHDTGICKAGQDSCITSPVGCGGDSPGLCFCLITTGKAAFCALNGISGTCSRDEEWVATKGEGAACVVCGGVGQCAARCPDPT